MALKYQKDPLTEISKREFEALTRQLQPSDRKQILTVVAEVASYHIESDTNIDEVFDTLEDFIIIHRLNKRINETDTNS